ncbi:MAG: hypothetical protein ABR499_11735 [Gemmatimonadaceae bacterium]
MTGRFRAAAGRERTGDHQASRHARASLWEWAAAAAGAAVVITALGFLVYEAMTLGPHPTPKIAIRVDTVIGHGAGYTVEYRAMNEGDGTAAQVLVRGELRDDTGVIEQSESTIDFVPAHSWRLGGLVFKNDPRRYRMDVRPVGFDKP